jgi:hypothetical protein
MPSAKAHDQSRTFPGALLPRINAGASTQIYTPRVFGNLFRSLFRRFTVYRLLRTNICFLTTGIQ